MTDKKQPETESSQGAKTSRKTETILEMLERLGLGDSELAEAYRRSVKEQREQGAKRPVEVIAVMMKSKPSPGEEDKTVDAKRQKDDSGEPGPQQS